jgi:proline dehydrogenase
MNLLNSLIVSTLQFFPESWMKPFAMRYIAGERLEDAVHVVKTLNGKSMAATMDVLGEDVYTKEESLMAVKACEEVLHSIQENHLNANLSIKLTQFGLKIDEGFCYANVENLLGIARRYRNFVRIDMEDSSVTRVTLKPYERLCSEGFENVGGVIQAYLSQSEKDIKALSERKVNVRLVKGIYIEPESIAFKGREEIRQNYLRLLKILLRAGCYVGIATHDDPLIRGAYQYIREMSLQKSDYEFQMLYGVRMGLRDQIVADGHRMRIYIPFGRHWYSYSLRRFKENPQIARYVLQALFFRNQ